MEQQVVRTVLATQVESQPVADFIVQVAHDNPDGLKNWDIVQLSSTVEDLRSQNQPPKILPLAICAVVLENTHRRSKSGIAVPPGCIRVDQTLRQALSVRKAPSDSTGPVDDERCHVGVRRVGRWRWWDTVFSWLDLQKAVVRVQVNQEAMEQFTPVVCLPANVMARIGSSYGSRVVVEASDGRKISAKCVRLDDRMKAYARCVEQGLKDGDDCSPYTDGPLWRIGSEGFERDDVPPAFLDAILRHRLGDVQVGQPVKVRRSLLWEIRRKLSELGPVALLAVTLLAPPLFERDGPSGRAFVASLIVVGVLILLGAWATLAASKYRGNNDLS